MSDYPSLEDEYDDQPDPCEIGCSFQDGHDGPCITPDDIAEGKLRASDYDAWAAL